MSDYKPTTIADVLAHVSALKADVECELRGNRVAGIGLAIGSVEEHWNYSAKRELQGQLLAIAKIEGFLEARIQIDEIYGSKTTREILEGNLQYDLGRPE